MDEAGDRSLLQHLAKGNAHAVSEDNAGRKHCSDLSTKDMDNKENLYTASENGSDFLVASRAMPPTGRASKGGGCNLRKSLAWNKAFFTEEGVLDPLELSILSGSAPKPSVSFFSGINGEISPLTSYGISSRVNLDNRVRRGSAFDDKKEADLFSALEPSAHKDSVSHVVTEKATLSKGICRNIPRAPAVFSQKRQANTNTSNPASKLPKFTATKSQTSTLIPTASCSVPTRKHSNQNAKPANIEQNARSKGFSLTLKKALNYPTSSSRSSELAYEKKTVSENSELPSSADTQTPETGKCISYLRIPQSHLPPNRLSASVGRSNFEKVAHSFSQNSQHIKGGNPPAQGQAKPSGLRMPTPSFGFFRQAKILPHVLQLQNESQKSGACDHCDQSLKKSSSLKLTDDIETLHTSHGQGQPGGSESTGTKASAIVISTPFSSKNTDFSGGFVVPSVTNPTFSPDIGQEASMTKILRGAIKHQVASGQQNDQVELHSYCLMDVGNMGKQSDRQGSGCEPESPNNLVLSMDNSSLPVEREFANTMTQTNQFENAGGMYLASEDSGRHQLPKSNVILQKCFPKQSQQGDCGMGDSVMCQQWEYACETSISAGNEYLPDRKHGLFSGLSFGNNGKCVDRCPLLEIETSLRSSKTQVAGTASLQLVCSSTENAISSVERENTECAVHSMGQHGLNSDTSLLDNVHGAEESGLQGCGVGSDRCPLLETVTSFRSSKTQVAGTTSLQLVCSSTENIVSSVEVENTEYAVHSMAQHGLNSDTTLLEEVHGTEESELQDCGVSLLRKKNQIGSRDESEVIVNKQELMEKPKQVSMLLNQLKAEPFSDEWVAALESFGEDVLRMKTGAVQNSPPDKPTPELGPWSPVKRKNQDIGPYDCTKYTKSSSTASPQ